MSATIPLEPGNYYHIYNRGNNGENIFIEDQNYQYFLKLFKKYVTPVVDTFAYCLLKNHFHISLRVKSSNECCRNNESNAVQRFGHFFNAYAKSINKQFNRTGSLFQNRFKRKVITKEKYFVQLIIYIHQNPERHQLIGDYRKWPYSSYHSILQEKPTNLQRDEVLDWFGGKESYYELHNMKLNKDMIQEIMEKGFE
ncbi:hypothetical protein JW835_09850 [bacterium]|nr:hypothetical protein [bacterium]